LSARFAPDERWRSPEYRINQTFSIWRPTTAASGRALIMAGPGIRFLTISRQAASEHWQLRRRIPTSFMWEAVKACGGPNLRLGMEFINRKTQAIPGNISAYAMASRLVR